MKEIPGTVVTNMARIVQDQLAYPSSKSLVQTQGSTHTHRRNAGIAISL